MTPDPFFSCHCKYSGLGELVVWEIELKDQKVVRLAIDFITDTRANPIPGGWPRLIIRGSLRYNSQFEPSVPELDPDAAE